MNEHLLVVIFILIGSSSLIAARSTYENNEEIKKMIEEAGCDFRSTKQHLTRDVCLSQNYELNKMPANPGGKLSVNMTLLSVIVMEVHEKNQKDVTLSLRSSAYIRFKKGFKGFVAICFLLMDYEANQFVWFLD